MDDGPGLEPRHIDTVDENALELPSGEAVPLDSPRLLPEAEKARRRKLMAAAIERYRLALAAMRRRGGGDEPIEPIGPIEPVHGGRQVRETRL